MYICLLLSDLARMNENDVHVCVSQRAFEYRVPLFCSALQLKLSKTETA